MQYSVQQQSGSSDPEIAREILAEQPTQVGGRGRHEVLPANREGDLPTSTIQSQRNERNMSQVDLDQLQGIESVQEYPVRNYRTLPAFFDLPIESKNGLNVSFYTRSKCNQIGMLLST